MLWMWLPIVLAGFAVCIWLAVAVVRRRGGDGVPEEGHHTVYDRAAEEKKAPHAPPT